MHVVLIRVWQVWSIWIIHEAKMYIVHVEVEKLLFNFSCVVTHQLIVWENCRCCLKMRFCFFLSHNSVSLVLICTPAEYHKSHTFVWFFCKVYSDDGLHFHVVCVSSHLAWFNELFLLSHHQKCQPYLWRLVSLSLALPCGPCSLFGLGWI